MERLKEDIKTGHFEHFYLLWGEEKYLVNQFKNNLIKALNADDNSMNYHVFSGKEISAGEIIDTAETLPFFSERQVILVEDSPFFREDKKESDADDADDAGSTNDTKAAKDMLAEYVLGEIPDTTYMVFVEKNPKKNSKLYKALQKKGRIVELGTQKEPMLRKWILSQLKREQLNISEAAFDLFMQMTGPDMQNMKIELDKLICYCMGKELIMEKDVEEVCIQQIQGKIFDMINATVEHRTRKALDGYYDLRALKEPEIKILVLIARQYNNMLMVKQLKNEGMDIGRIAERLSMQEFAVKRIVGQTNRLSVSEIRRCLEACIEAEEAIKTGRMSKELALETLLVSCASG